MGVKDFVPEDLAKILKEKLRIKNNQIISIITPQCQVDIKANLNPGTFAFNLINMNPNLNSIGETVEENEKMLQTHDELINKLNSKKEEFLKMIENEAKNFELNKVINKAFEDVNQKLNNRKTLLLSKQTQDFRSPPSISSLTPSFLSETEFSPKLLKGLRDKGQKFGLTCTLEVQLIGNPEPQVFWYLNNKPIAKYNSSEPNEQVQTHTKNITATRTNNNVYRLMIENFGREDTGKYTMIAKNKLGEISCSSFVEHVSTHSSSRSQFSNSPYSYGSSSSLNISRERLDETFLNSPLSYNTSAHSSLAPTFLKSLHPIQASEGDLVKFSVQIQGHPDPSVRWFREGVEIFNSPDFKLFRDAFNQTSYSLEIPEIFSEDAGKFTCVAQNIYGSAQSTATLQVRERLSLSRISDNSLESACSSQSGSSLGISQLGSGMVYTHVPSPGNVSEQVSQPYFRAISKDMEVGEGHVARFDALVVGKPIPDVMWFKGDDMRLMTDNKYSVVVNEKGVHSLIINSVTPMDQGVYKCLAQNKGGQNWFQVVLKVTVGFFGTRYSPTNSMTKLPHASPPNQVNLIKNFHSEERSYNRLKTTHHQSNRNFQSEDRKVMRRNFYKSTNSTTQQVRSSRPLVPTRKGYFLTNTNDGEGPPILIKTMSEPDDIKEGLDIQLSCQIYSPGNCCYQWFFNNKPLNPDPNKYLISHNKDYYNLVIKNIDSHTDRGFYQVTVANDDGEVTCIGRVNPIGTLYARSPITNRPPSSLIIVLDEVTLSCTVSGDPKPKLSWFLEDELLWPNSQLKPSSSEISLQDFEVSYNESTGFAEMKIKNVRKYLNKKVRCEAVNDQGTAETECFLSENLLGDPLITDWNYANLLIQQIHNSTSTHLLKTGPRFSQRIQPSLVEEGDHVTLTAVVHGRPQPLVKWFKNGDTEILNSDKYQIIIDEENHKCKLKIFNCTPEDSGTYSCLAFNPSGQSTCSASILVNSESDKSITFDIETGLPISSKLPLFRVSLEPKYEINPGQPVKFTCHIKKEPSTNVTWYFNGVEISSGHVMKVTDGDILSTLTIPEPKPLNSGEYACLARNLYGESRSTTHLFIKGFPPNQEKPTDQRNFCMPVVQTQSLAQPPNDTNNNYNDPPVFSQPLVNHIVTKGNEVFFMVKFSGEPIPSIQWFINGNLVTKQNTNCKVTTDFYRSESILYIREAEIGDEGEYTCKAENISGIAYSTSHLYIKVPNYQPKNESNQFVYDSTTSLNNEIFDNGRPKFNVELNLVKPQESLRQPPKYFTSTLVDRNKLKREIVVENDKETRRLEVERKYQLDKPNNKFSETISIDKSEERLVELDLPKKKHETSELVIRNSPRIVKLETPKTPRKEIIVVNDQETKKLTKEKNFILQKEPNFSETVAIDKREIQEVLFDKPTTKQSSELTVHQQSSLKGMKLEAEVILVEEPKNFTETVSIDKSEQKTHEIEFSIPRSNQSSELTVQQKSMLVGKTIEAEIFPEVIEKSELVVDRGAAEFILLEEPKNFSETVSIDKTEQKTHEVEFSLPKTNLTSELTVQQKSMLVGSTIEAEISPEKKEKSELTVERGFAPKFLIELVPLSVMDGSPVAFTTKIEASPMPQKIAWFRNEKNCEEIVHIITDYNIKTGVSNLHISEVFPEDAGVYTCVVSNKFGIAKSSAKLTVSAYDQTDYVEYMEVTTNESLSDSEVVSLQSELVENKTTKTGELFSVPTHAKLLMSKKMSNESVGNYKKLLEEKANYIIEPQKIEKPQERHSQTFRALQIIKGRDKFEGIDETQIETLSKVIEKGLINLQKSSPFITAERKPVVLTLAQLATLNRELEAVGLIENKGFHDKVQINVESKSSIQSFDTKIIEFFVELIKKEKESFEVVNENLLYSDDETVEKISDVSNETPLKTQIVSLEKRAKKSHKVPTMSRTHFAKVNMGSTENLKDQKINETSKMSFESKELFEKNVTRRQPTLARTVKKRADSFETVGRYVESSGYESTGILSDSSDHGIKKTEIVTNVLTAAKKSPRVENMSLIRRNKTSPLEEIQSSDSNVKKFNASQTIEPFSVFEPKTKKGVPTLTKMSIKRPDKLETVSGVMVESEKEISKKKEVLTSEVFNTEIKKATKIKNVSSNVKPNILEWSLEKVNDWKKGIIEEKAKTSSIEDETRNIKKLNKKIQSRTNEIKQRAHEVVDTEVPVASEETLYDLGFTIQQEACKSEISSREIKKSKITKNISTNVQPNVLHWSVEKVSDLLKFIKHDQANLTFTVDETDYAEKSLKKIGSRVDQMKQETYETVNKTFPEPSEECLVELELTKDKIVSKSQLEIGEFKKAKKIKNITSNIKPKILEWSTEKTMDWQTGKKENKATLSFIEDDTKQPNKPSKKPQSHAKELTQKNYETAYKTIPYPSEECFYNSEQISNQEAAKSHIQTAEMKKAKSCGNILTNAKLLSLQNSLEKVSELLRNVEENKLLISKVDEDTKYINKDHKKIQFRTNQMIEAPLTYEKTEEFIGFLKTFIEHLTSNNITIIREVMNHYLSSRTQFKTSISQLASLESCQLQPFETQRIQEKAKINYEKNFLKTQSLLKNPEPIYEAFRQFESIQSIKAEDKTYKSEIIVEHEAKAELEIELKKQEKSVIEVFPQHIKKDALSFAYFQTKLLKELSAQETNISFDKKISSDLKKAYQYLEDESDSQAEYISVSNYEIKPAEKALEKYVSQTTILTDSKKISENYIKPTIESNQLEKIEFNFWNATGHRASKDFQQKTILSKPEKKKTFSLASIQHEKFKEDEVLQTKETLSKDFASSSTTANILSSQTNKKSKKTFAPLLQAKDDFVDSVLTLELDLKPEVIYEKEVSLDKWQPSSKKEKVNVKAIEEYNTQEEENELFVEARENLDNISFVSSDLLVTKPFKSSQFVNATSQITNLNLEGVETYQDASEKSFASYDLTKSELLVASKPNAALQHGSTQTLRTTEENTNQLDTRVNVNICDSYLVDSSLSFHGKPYSQPTFIKTLLESANNEHVSILREEAAYNHAESDMIIDEFNKGVKTLKPLHHVFSNVKHVDEKFLQIQPDKIVNSAISLPANIFVKLMRLESIETTIYRTQILKYLMLLEKELALKTVDINNNALILPFPEIVSIESDIASKNNKPLMRVLTNVYFIRLEETKQLEIGETCEMKTEFKQEASPIKDLASLKRNLNYNLSQIKSQPIEMVKELIIKRASDIICSPQNVVCKLERANKKEAVLYRSPLSTYILLLERLCSIHSVNIDDISILLPHSEQMGEEKGVATTTKKPLNRIIPDVIFLQVDGMAERDYTFEVFNLQSKLLAEEKTHASKNERPLTHSFINTIQKMREEVEKEIKKLDGLMYSIPQVIQSHQNRCKRENKMLTRVSETEYVMLLERMMAFQGSNVDALSINIPQTMAIRDETNIASINNRPLNRNIMAASYLRLDNSIPKDMTFKEYSLKPIHIFKEIFQASKEQRPLNHSQSIQKMKKQEILNPSDIGVQPQAGVYITPQIISSTLLKIYKDDKKLFRTCLAQYIMLLEHLRPFLDNKVDNLIVHIDLPVEVVVETFKATMNKRPLSQARQRVAVLGLEKTEEKGKKPDVEAINSCEVKGDLKIQDQITEVEERIFEEEEKKEKEVLQKKPKRPDEEDEMWTEATEIIENKRFFEEQIKNEVEQKVEEKPEKEDVMEDMFETWETILRKEITREAGLDIEIESKQVDEYKEDMFETWEETKKTRFEIEEDSDAESEISITSMYEEWEFTTITKTIVEEEVPMKRKIIEIKHPEKKGTNIVMGKEENTIEKISKNLTSEEERYLRETNQRIVTQLGSLTKSHYSRPTFDKDITFTKIKKNKSVIFSTHVIGVPEPTIEWYINGFKIQESPNFTIKFEGGFSTLTIKRFSSRHLGRFTCRAFNEAGINETFTTIDENQLETENVDNTFEHITTEEGFIETIEKWTKVTSEEYRYKEMGIPTSPSFEQEISSFTVEDGKDAVLFCKLNSFPNAKVEWYFRGKMIKQTSDFIMGYHKDYCFLIIKETLAHDQGEYKIKASNDHGTAETSVYLTVLDSYELNQSKYEELNSQFFTKTSKFSSEQTDEFYSSGEETLDQWVVEEWLFYDFKKYYNVDVYMKKQQNYIVPFRYIPYDEQSFRARISSKQAALMDRHPFRFPVIIKELPILEVFEGTKVVIECSVEACPEPEIIWYKNGKPLVSNNHVTLKFSDNICSLIIEKVSLDDEAEYKCEARNEYGSSFTWGQIYVETVQLRWGRIKNFKIVRKKSI